MCENIEIDLTDDTLKSLTILLDAKIKPLLDECSYAIFKESKITTPDELYIAVGSAMMNGVLVETIKEALEQYDAKEESQLP